ncbi:MAG: ABC transporter substrate-binding protein, partial [Nitrososphaerales archaeon]
LITAMDVIDDYNIDVTYDSNSLTNKLNASAFFFVFMHPSQQQEQLVVDPIGAGPFVKKSFTPGTELILERVKDWWGDKIPEAESTTFFKAKGNIDEVSFVTIKEIASAVTALRSGDVDMVAALSLPTVAEVRTIPNVEAVSTGPLGWLFFHLNSLYEPLSDVRVRRAINHSVDRGALLNLYANLVDPLDTLIPPGKYGHDPSVKNYEFDLDRAKTLMSEAGYKDGFEMVLVGVTSIMDPQRMDSTIAISAMMKEIGIDAPPLQEDTPKWIRTILKRDQTRIHMFPFRRSMTFRAPDDVLPFFERNIMPGRGQLATIDHDDLIEIVNKAGASPDPVERDNLYKQAQKIYMDQAIAVNYALFVGYQGVSNRVTAPRWPSEQFIFPYTVSVQ